MKITYQKAFLINNLLSQLVLTDDQNTYAVKRNLNRLKPIIEDWSDLKLELTIKKAAKNKETGHILKDSIGGYEFTQEDTIALNKELRALERLEIDFEPCLLPKNDEMSKYTNSVSVANSLDILLDICEGKEEDTKIKKIK